VCSPWEIESLKLTIMSFSWSFVLEYSEEQKEIWWVFTYIHAFVMILFAAMWTILQGQQSIQGHMTQHCHEHPCILGILHRVLISLFPMKTESGIASQECGGNWFVTLRDSISFGQSLRSWWENEREYGLLLFRGVWPPCTGKKFWTMKFMSLKELSSAQN